MKIPLDYLCVKTGVLCPRCQGLVSSGQVSEYEVDVLRALLDLEEKPEFKFLHESTYVKSFKNDDVLIVVIEEPNELIDPRVLSRLSKSLSEYLNVKARVITNVKDLKELVKQLVFPARISGVNTVWLPDGSVEHIIRVPRQESRYLPIRRELLEEVLTKIVGSVVRVRTE